MKSKYFHLGKSVKEKAPPGSLPCHFWCSLSRLGCTWAFPWRPPARPELHLPSTVTCKCFEWVLPAGVGPAVPLHQTGSAVWGCQSLQWSGYGVAYRRGCRSQKNMTCHTDIKIRLPISIWAHKKPDLDKLTGINFSLQPRLLSSSQESPLRKKNPRSILY